MEPGAHVLVVSTSILLEVRSPEAALAAVETEFDGEDAYLLTAAARAPAFAAALTCW
jgi:hypothetical protein